MKRISKSLRSISPFRKQSVSEEAPDSKMKTEELQSPSDEENNNTNNNNVHNYNLSGVSFKDFLVYFYSKYNPEKINMIDYIAKEYQGDELIMISNLSDKYKLNPTEMQQIIDMSKRTNATKARPPPSDTDSEPESEPNSEPVSELSTSSLRNSYSSQQRMRKGVSFSNANSVRTYDRNASPARIDTAISSAPASLQDIINRGRQQEPASSRQNIINKGLLGNSLLSPAQQQGSHKPSPSMRSPSPTLGRGNGPKPQPHPAPVRSSSPLQTAIRNQTTDDTDRLQNQRNLREKMLQNQQQEMLQHQRQQYMIQKQQEKDREFQQRQQQQEEEKHKQLKQVVEDDEKFVAEQVRNAERLHHDKDHGSSRTETIQLEEIQAELDRTRQALTVADQERAEVLRLLEEMAAAPHSARMQSVVEEYLGNRTRANSIQSVQSEDVTNFSPKKQSSHSSPSYQSDYQIQLQQAQANKARNNSNLPGGDSVVSSGSSSIHGLRDLEGEQQQRTRSLSPALHKPGGNVTSKSYMMGTASSTRRETSTAKQGGKTGAFNINASGNGRYASPSLDRPNSASSSSRGGSMRSSSTGGQQSGQRYLRAGSNNRAWSANSLRARGRSPSPSGSDYSRRNGTSVRSSSPSSSITSTDVERQYNHAKQQLESSTQQARGNQQAGRNRYDQVYKESSLERQKAVTNSPARQRNLNPENVTDWVVCVDPKSQRKYYYSRTLKQSTWTPPPHLAPGSIPTKSGPPSRSGSQSRGSTPRRNSRDSSPAGSTSHVRAPSPVSSTTSSSRGGGSLWKSAKDPKTGRTYWFNRKTRESTWKNPYE